MAKVANRVSSRTVKKSTPYSSNKKAPARTSSRTVGKRNPYGNAAPVRNKVTPKVGAPVSSSGKGSAGAVQSQSTAQNVALGRRNTAREQAAAAAVARAAIQAAQSRASGGNTKTPGARLAPTVKPAPVVRGTVSPSASPTTRTVAPAPAVVRPPAPVAQVTQPPVVSRPAAPTPVTSNPSSPTNVAGGSFTSVGRPGTFGQFNRQRRNRGPLTGLSITPEMLQAMARQRITR